MLSAAFHAALKTCALVAFAMIAVALHAAHLQAQTESGSKTPLTLHVYENLMQFPVVVLSDLHVPIKPLAPDRFFVSLDSGPQFRPTHVRSEGDDPISLSILIDLRFGKSDLVKKIGAAVSELSSGSLQGRDRIFFYIQDPSKITRVLYDEPVLPSLGKTVSLALGKFPKAVPKRGAEADYDRSMAIWDGAAYVVDQASRLPGRRVILALSDRSDEYGLLTWPQVKNLATRAGVAIFGLRTGPLPSFRFDAPSFGREDRFQSLCELSGGLVFTATEKSLNRRMTEFVTLLRNRYIVEFPRPDNLAARDYSIEVTIPKLSAFIRPVGMSVPLADPKLLSDPNTLKPDPSLSPPIGSRKVIPPPAH